MYSELWKKDGNFPKQTLKKKKKHLCGKFSDIT